MKGLFWFLLALSGAIYLAMNVWTFPPLIEAAGGLMPFDLRPFGYSAEEARAYLAAIPDEGIAIYLGPQHMLDLFFPAVLAGMFAVGEMILFRRAIVILLVTVAILGAVLDYAENRLVTEMLKGPDPSDALIARASLATVGKSVAAVIGYVALILGGLRAGIARIRGRA